MSKGIIYITRTEQDHPNYYKVGRTSLSSANERTRHDQTYISGGIKTIREFEVTDPVEAEKAAHLELLNYRVNAAHAKEIYDLDIDILIGKVKSAINPWLLGSKIIDEGKWLLDFLKETEISPITTPFNDHNLDKTIESMIELLMRSITEPKGLSINLRLEPNKDYEELIQNTEIGNNLQNSIQYIDHKSLINIENWQDKIQIFLFLSKAPIFNPLSADFRKKMFKNRDNKLKHGLRGFNINKIIDYWSNNYFKSNPSLILHLFEFVKINIHDIENLSEENILKAAKLSVLKNAMKFCINNPNAKYLQIYRKTHDFITYLLGGHLIMTHYPEIFSEHLISEFMDLRIEN